MLFSPPICVPYKQNKTKEFEDIASIKLHGISEKGNQSLDDKSITHNHMSLTSTAGQMHVGGRMWSRNSPILHSGLTCDAHLLCNYGERENENKNENIER